ncbi:MAG: stage II sporulation protein P [Clostridia bacterium]|nr:stage II sporulation protein P [Clostridia bacterium]
MKNTVSFFERCKQYILNLFKYAKVTTSFIISIVLIIICGIYFLKTSNGMEGLITFATNVRLESKTKEYTVADLIKAYPVFNGDNYIVDESKNIQNVDKAQKEDISPDTSLFDASAVDVISNYIEITKENYTKKSTKNYDRIDMYGITIYDYSSKNIDYQELMERNVDLTKMSDPILLYCSHTSETYDNSENFKFGYTGTYRTKDASYNMLSVASVMSNTLKDRGFTTIFDTTPHDYTSYDNAYKNSLKTINTNIDKYNRFGVMIDVHRDAAADLSFAPTTTVNGKSTAQLMLVVGVGYNGFPNEYWEQNLALALKITKLGEEMYPGLFRHILVRDARYNQHLAPGSLLVEVGATGNTLEEAYYGARCFANILSKLYK